MIFWRWYMQKQEAEIQQAKADGITEGETRGLAKGRVEGEAAGIVKGISATYQLWSSWNIRRMEAERQNLPFDEPPPPLPEVTAE